MRLPGEGLTSPARQLGARLLFGIGLILVVTALVYFGREGYVDNSDDSVDLLDSLYYSTVSITTTGYGDVVPVSDKARAVTTFLVTPMRMAFLVLLVGTSLELIASATRSRFNRHTWRRKVHDHIVICGFGVKGQSALESLTDQNVPAESIVVIDESSTAVEAAVRAGHVGICGDMTSNLVLREARVELASTVIVAPNRDDAAVLTTLSVRSLNPAAHIVASSREFENAPLLRSSGADVVLTSSGSTGRMLGLATTSPYAVAVIEDLLEIGRGFDIGERIITAAEAGPLSAIRREDELVIAIYRDGEVVTRAPRGDVELFEGDRAVIVHGDGTMGS